MTKRGFIGVGSIARSAAIMGLVALPSLALGQAAPNVTPSVAAPPTAPVAAPAGSVPAAPAPAAAPVALPAPPAPVPSGPATPSLPPVPQITLPSTPGSVVPTPTPTPAPGPSGPGSILGTLPPTTATPSLPPVPRLTVPPAPPPPLTPIQQARLLSPGFVVNRDYNRLVQCYGTANYMEAVTRVQANRAGSSQGLRAMTAELIRLQGAMQPMVLVASDARTERRFRADYSAVGDRLQAQLRTSRAADATLQANLQTVIACQPDIARWRGEGRTGR